MSQFNREQQSMDALSSWLLPKTFIGSISHSLPYKNITLCSFQISSSLKISEDKPQQRRRPSVPTSSKTRRKDTGLPEQEQTFTVQIQFNALKKNISSFFRRPLRPSLDPNHVLSNNYAPVNELPPEECLVIKGVLPPCLDGAYIRNGPNPQYPPQGPYHLFDGDGMLHCLRISNGRATLSSRFIRTFKYNVEHEIGSPVFPNVFSGLISGLPTIVTRGAVYSAMHLSGKYNLMKDGVGLANTSLAYFGGKLFALGESDLPYQIQITPTGDIETVGRYNFDGRNMTAHPKVDAKTGEAFAFRYSPIYPFLMYFRFDSKGSKQPDIPIYSMSNPSFIHDFAITEKYAIFADIQIGANTNLLKIITGGEPLVQADQKKMSRVGIIPRYANNDSEMKWFDVPGFNMIHAVNAWDEEDSIVLVAPNIKPVEHTLEKMDLIHASVEKVRIDLKTGTVIRSTISSKNLDFGVINPAFVGRKNRYGYLGVGDPLPKTSGVVKLDLSLGAEVGCRMFRKGCYGGEPFFVPRRHVQAKTEVEKDEDDGYLVMYVHDEYSNVSSFLVMDAKSETLDILAEVKLPRRVPYGFHGLFVKESDLRVRTVVDGSCCKL